MPAVALAIWLAPGTATAKVYMTQEEALSAAFPGGAPHERRTVYLTQEQGRRLEEMAGEEPRSLVVIYYSGPSATAWFDTHLVRTKPETIMIVVSPEGTIRRIDILSFDEPEEYLPRDRWLRQIDGRKLDEDLSLKRGIRPISGATLSGRAIVAASRRALALHRLLVAEAAGTGGSDDGGGAP